MTWVLVNAEERAKKTPATFSIPRERSRKSLSIGDFAKLIFELKVPPSKGPSGERMWVRVTHTLEGQCYRGVLCNDPLLFEGLKRDVEIVFGPEHVVDFELKELSNDN